MFDYLRRHRSNTRVAPNDRTLALDFEVEQMCLDSGKFDYSEPKFFNLFKRRFSIDADDENGDSSNTVINIDSNEYMQKYKKILIGSFQIPLPNVPLLNFRKFYCDCTIGLRALII